MSEEEADRRGGTEDGARGQRFSLRAHRLHKSDFKRIYAEGSRARGSLMTVVVSENGLGRNRMGLSVGKRCAKLAVDRNRVRRVFREAFRLSHGDLGSGMDVILIASTPGIRPRLEPTRLELELLVRKALRRYRERASERGTRGDGAGDARERRR